MTTSVLREHVQAALDALATKLEEMQEIIQRAHTNAVNGWEITASIERLPMLAQECLDLHQACESLDDLTTQAEERLEKFGGAA